MQGFVLSSRKLDFASWTLHMKCIIYRLSVCRRSLGECIPENFSCCWNKFFFFQQSGLNLRRKKKKHSSQRPPAVLIGLKNHRCPQIPHCSSYTNRFLKSSGMTQRCVCFGCRLSFLLNTSSLAAISTRRGHRRSTGASRVSGDEPLVELVWSVNRIDSTATDRRKAQKRRNNNFNSRCLH